ncbi:uncharacterized protein [Glycine max]|uniref:uncharacterized protein isoform X2 n=1 Tax=Glycine max TaxID=3847 RepID=UPI000E21C0AA|nr:uncharacterized protein LOC112997693 isoform X2 [Glycine max]|eukprot:XP_025982335.1 uncharacterized protein LOC112997693 isoform X2 [Glycine max]
MPDTGRARVRNDNKLSHIDKKNSDMHHHGAIEVKQLNELMGSCGQGFQVYIIGHFQQFQLISILAVTIVTSLSMKTMGGPFSTGYLKLNLNHPRSLSFSGSMEDPDAPPLGLVQLLRLDLL